MTPPWRVIREPEDPLALRASIGGNDDVGHYLVFRGDPQKVVDMLKSAAEQAEALLPAHRYIDKRGTR